MFDVKFKDSKGNIFTYTTYNATMPADAEILWKTYVEKHFPNEECKIITVKKVI